MTDETRISFPTPLYVVAAPLGPESDASQSAFLVGEVQAGTFDDEVLPALVGIWYAMHLPKNRFETLDIPLAGVHDQVNGVPPRSHSIALVPDTLLDKTDLMRRLVTPYEPALIIAAADRIEVAERVSSELNFTVPPARFDQLDQSSLFTHWERLASRWSRDWPQGAVLDPAVPRWSWPISQDGSLLSLQRLSRLMGAPLDTLPEYKNPYESAAHVRYRRVHLDALVQLEEEGIGPADAVEVLPTAVREMSNSTRTRLTVSLPGTAPRYIRLSTGGGSASNATFNDDYPQVRTLLVTHSAVGDDSMGIVLEDVLTPQTFQALADLERHWGERPRPPAVRRILNRLNDASSGLWSEPFVAAVRSASSIDAFTNFPIGLLTLPGDSSPLSARLPISYKTVNPLTRALQFELNPQVPHDLSKGARVLVAECIPDSDPVGQLSRMGWKLVAKEMSATGAGVDVVIVETLTRDALRATVAEVEPDILVLSAHGFSAPESNLAGVVIGDEHSLGDDLGDMPPLVILSACHTSPRGGGAVNVGDLLLRAGALAVLSTLVPVDVRHNSQIVSRFFRYLALAMKDRSPGAVTSVLEVWHQVQGLNAVIDLTYGNPRLQHWAFSRTGGVSPIERFMTGDHGMRRAHLYADAEARLIEIASRTGEDQRVREWLRTPGYLPESLMYTMLGSPRLLTV
jgi:hypothetical protein